MTKTAITFIFFALSINAQTNFQPPSWGQGTGQGQGQGSQHAQSDSINRRIQDLQSQINHLRTLQRQQLPHVEVQTGPVLGHPISGKETRHTKQTLSDGATVDRSDVSYFSRDAAGRMRDESPTRVEIFDTLGHAEYDLTPAKKIYTKTELSGNEKFISVAVFGNTSNTATCGEPTCGGMNKEEGVTEDLGQQSVNGVMAKGSRITIEIPVGAIGNDREIKIVNERWYSDDLQLLVKSINTDPRFGVNEYELTNISQGIPDPSLFMPPPDYTLIVRGAH